MIRKSGGWIHERDLKRPINGRVDPPELVEECERYLSKDWIDPGVDDAVPTATQAKQVQAELAADLVRANAAISRLLAFVPTRALELSKHRLQSLLGELSRVTQASFQLASGTIITVAPENDVETEACHQITIAFAVPADVSMEQVVKGTADIHLAAAKFLTVDELRAVRICVEPIFEAVSPDDEPS